MPTNVDDDDGHSKNMVSVIENLFTSHNVKCQSQLGIDFEEEGIEKLIVRFIEELLVWNVVRCNRLPW